MQIGITFDKQMLTSRQHAHFYNLFLNHTDGITKGCGLSYTADNVFVDKGFFVVSGRFVEVTGMEQIETPSVISGQLYCKVVYEIDLTLENSESDFRQGYFRTLTSTTGYPDVTQEDLDDNGTFYQMPFCQYIKGVGTVSSFVDLRPIFDIESVWAAVADNNESYKTEFDSFYDEAKLEVEKMVDDLKEEGFVLVSDARNTIEITLPASGWPSSSPYTQSISISGMTADKTFDVGINYPSSCTRSNQKAINKAAGYIYSVESSSGAVTFMATEKPITDIPLVLKGVI